MFDGNEMTKIEKAGCGCLVGFAALIVLVDIIMGFFAGVTCFGKMPDCGGGGRGDVYMGPMFWGPFAFVAAIVVAFALVQYSKSVSSSDANSIGRTLVAATVLPFSCLLFYRGDDLLMPLLLFPPVSVPLGIAAIVILSSGRKAITALKED